MIKPIEHYSIQNVPTVYDEEALTVLQLVARLTGKTNECINMVNSHTIEMKGHVNAIVGLNETISNWTKNIDSHMKGISETLGELVVEPLGFATPQMFGATGDGVADDTQAIKAAINSLADHNALLYFPPGTYLVTEDIDLKNNITVKGSGGRSVIKRAPNANTHYCIFRCEDIGDVYISDLYFLGDKDTHTGTDGEWGMCISLEGASNITIERCYMVNGWGDGVYVGVNEMGLYTSNLIIRNCTIVGNRRNGISVISVDGLTIDGCLISATKGTLPEAGIDFEPNTKGQTVSNVKISNTTFTGNSKDVLFADTENDTFFDKYVLFTGCDFNSGTGLDWRTPLDGEMATTNADCFVKFVGCMFNNSSRCVRVTKANWDTLITFSGCDFSTNSIAIEVGESGKDYGGMILGGLSFLDCRVLSNGSSNPVLRGVGSNAVFADIVADLHTKRTIKAYGYFSGTAENINLNFHDAVFQIGVDTSFDKYKVPSTIYISTNATNQGTMVTFTDTFPVGQVVRVINDSSSSEIEILHGGQEVIVNGAYKLFYVTITPAGKIAVLGGI